MTVKAEEITKVLKAKIANYNKSLEVSERGTVLSVGDGVARVHGLDQVKSGELVEFPGDVYGMALNLEEGYVGVVIFGNDSSIKEGIRLSELNVLWKFLWVRKYWEEL